MKYQLINRRNKSPLQVFIDESAREDIKELMGWDDADFNQNTRIVRD